MGFFSTMDRHIEMDRDNKLRLRMVNKAVFCLFIWTNKRIQYPNGAPFSPSNATREETRGTGTSSDTSDISTGRTIVLSSPWNC